MKKEIKVLIIGVAVLAIVFCIGTLSLLSLSRKNIPKNDEYKKLNETDLQKRLSDSYYGKVTNVDGDQIEILPIMKGLVVLPEEARTKVGFKTTAETKVTGSCSKFSNAEQEEPEGAVSSDTEKPVVEGGATEAIVSGGNPEDMCEVAITAIQLGNIVTVKEANKIAVSVTIY